MNTLIAKDKQGQPIKRADGRYLTSSHDCNRPGNLIALSSKEHRVVLAAKAKRIQELEALLRGQGTLI